jgi:hypothetical protein
MLASLSAVEVATVAEVVGSTAAVLGSGSTRIAARPTSASMTKKGATTIRWPELTAAGGKNTVTCQGRGVRGVMEAGSTAAAARIHGRLV